MTDVTPPPAPETPSAWEDLIDIFTAPSAVFERRREDPGFFLPFIVVTLLVGLIAFGTKDLMAPLFDAEWARGMAAAQRQNPSITAEQMEAGKGFASAMASFGAFVFIPIAILFVGIMAWLAGKLIGAVTSFGQAMMIAAFAYVPRIVESILGAVQAAFLSPEVLDGRYRLQIGAARFFDPDTANMAMVTLLGRLDLFTLWSTALIAIGLQVTGKLTLQKAIIGGGIVWLLATLWPLWGAIRAG